MCLGSNTATGLGLLGMPARATDGTIQLHLDDRLCKYKDLCKALSRVALFIQLGHF